MNTATTLQPPVQTKDGLLAEFLSAAEVARLLGIAKTSLYDRLAHGELAYHRIGRRIRIRRDDLTAFLKRTRVDVRPPVRYAGVPTA